MTPRHPVAHPDALDVAAERTARALGDLAPHLVDGFWSALPGAADLVGRRLRGALYREGLRPGDRGPGRQHGFDRFEFADAPAEPATLLYRDAGQAGPGNLATRWAAGTDDLAAEVTDATVNLAIAYARRDRMDRALRDNAAPWSDVAGAIGSVAYSRFLPADERVLFFERLATDGHNLHPCGRTRLGWDTADVLAHDLETTGTWVMFVAVPAGRYVGDPVGEILRDAYPQRVPAAPPGYAVQPVHAWQYERLLARYDRDTVRPLDADALPVAPTAALRTVLLPPGEDDARRYLKLSLDIQVSSTRRTISVASTRNGPAISALLHRLLAAETDVLLLAETAGAALSGGAGRDRDAAAIVRDGLGDRLAPDELAVPGIALPARCPLTGRPVLAELVDRFAATTGERDPAARFVDAYAALLLPPLLRIATRYGVGLEAHLQNCVPAFRGGVPHRIILRDFAGLRLHLPRLRARAQAPRLWPGSLVSTDDVDVVRAKVAYTALQAHLGEIVAVLVGTHGLDEAAAWRRIRSLVDSVYAGLAEEPAMAAAALADHAFLTAPTVPHKALVRMRLAGPGDVYVPVENPLHG